MPGQVAAVLVDAGGPASRRPFDYLVPPELCGQVAVGSLVVVPFGRLTLRGLVVGFPETPSPARLRPIQGLYRSAVYADRHAGDLAAFISRRYAASLIEAYRAVLPAAIGGRPVRAWGPGPVDPPPPGSLAPPLEDALDLVRARGSTTARAAAAALGVSPAEALRRLGQLEGAGLVSVEALDRGGPAGRGPPTYQAQAFASDQEEKRLAARAPAQYRLWRWLAGQGGPVTLAGYPGPPAAAQRAASALAGRGLVSVGALPGTAPGWSLVPELGGRPGPPQLTGAQSAAVAAVMSGVAACRPERFLLYGVTGSGKTEVYLQVISGVLAMGRQALVLVPEIALVPQAVTRIAARFPGQVALLHSRMAAGERSRAWRDLAQGRLSVAVGPRSAAFAPLPRLGLVVVDEEQEPSYKQEDIPRYDARVVAGERARLAGVPVLYGSATPTLETMLRTAKGAAMAAATGAVAKPPDTVLLELPERIDRRPLPPVSTVDMRQELRQGNRTIFSRKLSEELGAALARREQAILFLNRRGLATFVLCRECGYVAKCPHCEVSLVLHAHDQSLRCHYCGHRERPPAACPRCLGSRIRHFGAGTQRAEAQVREMFPEARVARLDSDTAARRGQAEAILGAFARRELDVLVGTQMVGKGLDLPGVSLVGVVAADTSLALPDFRAAERTFGLITQVAGRTGRGDGSGQVVLQTYNPDHYSLRHAAVHDYDGFARQELDFRFQLGYPPFVHLALVGLSGPDERGVTQAAQEAARLAREAPAQGEGGPLVLGPSPAPLCRLQGRYRWHIVLKDADAVRLAAAAGELLDRLQPRLDAAVRASVDVDPETVL